MKQDKNQQRLALPCRKVALRVGRTFHDLSQAMTFHQRCAPLRLVVQLQNLSTCSEESKAFELADWWFQPLGTSLSLSIYVFLSLSISLSLYLSICLSTTYLSISLHLCFYSIFIFFSIFISISIYLLIYHSLSLSTYFSIDLSERKQLFEASFKSGSWQHQKRRLNVQKWSEHVVIYTILTSKCASRHSRVHFWTPQGPKVLRAWCVLAFSLENVL